MTRDATTRAIAPRLEMTVWMGVLAVLMAGMLGTFIAHNHKQHVKQAHSHYRRQAFTKMPVTVTRLFDPSDTKGAKGEELAVEAPALSPDGQQITYMVRQREDDLMDYEVDSIWLARQQGPHWQTSQLADGVEPFMGKTTTWFNPTFDHTGQAVITGYAGFNQVLGLPWLPSLTKNLTRIPVDQAGNHTADHAGGQVWLTPAQLGLPGEVLQHPKLSPNGQWLAFYTRKQKATRGIYVYHLPTKTLTRVSAQDDKHPTWSPDGKRLLFHYQRGGDALDALPDTVPEQAWLGYFDLTLNPDGSVTQINRVLLDAVTADYTFYKHPAQIPGTDWLVFHAKYTPDGPHVLCARRLHTGSTIVQLKPEWQGHPLKEAKHPANAITVPMLVFLGKQADHYAIFQLPTLPR